MTSPLDAIIAESPDGFSYLEAVRDAAGEIIDFRWVYINPAGARILQRGPEYLIGRRITEELPGVVQDGIFDAMKHTVQTGEPHVSNVTYQHEGIHGHFRISLQKHGDGFVSQFSDVTSIHRRLESVRESEELLRATFEMAPIGMAIVSLDNRFINVNAAFCDLTGYSLAELLSRAAPRLTHPADRDGQIPGVRDLLEGRVPMLEFDKRYVRKDGTIVPVHMRAVLARNRDGSPRHFVVQVVDISARRAHEDAQRLHSLVVDNLQDAIVVTDLEGRVLDANPAAERLFRMSLADARNLDLAELDMWGDLPTRREALSTVRTAGRWSGEVVAHLRDGSVRLMYSVIIALRNAEGSVIGTLGVHHDITESRETQQLFEAVARDIPGVVFRARVTGEGQTFPYMSPKAREILGIDPAALRDDGSLLRELTHPDDRAASDEAFRHSLATGEPYQWEGRVLVGDQYRWIRIVSQADPAAEPSGATAWHGLMLDVTREREAEEALKDAEARFQQAQKMESLGVLAGGVAHDFNNLLVGILGNADLALLELPPQSPARDLMKAVVTAAQRAAELCSQLLAYSGRGKFVVQRIDLNAVVTEMTQLLAVAISRNATMSFDLTADRAIEGDAVQIRQVVMNLLTNASDALGEAGGVIRVSTAVRHYEPAFFSGTYMGEELPAGDYVALEVHDSGPGMDEETRGRLFEPFFTTKFQGRGLGLSAVLGIVRGHRGAIDVRSAPGKGATFTVYFPALVPGAGPQVREAPVPVPEAARGCVLVIDDDDIVRDLACRVLTRAGFSALPAEDGRRGLEQFRAHRNEVTVVLLDLTMPGMSGEEVLAELRRVDPQVRVVITSGYSELEAEARFRDAGIAGFLQKPYLPSVLVDRIVGGSGE